MFAENEDNLASQNGSRPYFMDDVPLTWLLDEYRVSKSRGTPIDILNKWMEFYALTDCEKRTLDHILENRKQIQPHPTGLLPLTVKVIYHQFTGKPVHRPFHLLKINFSGRWRVFKSRFGMKGLSFLKSFKEACLRVKSLSPGSVELDDFKEKFPALSLSDDEAKGFNCFLIKQEAKDDLDRGAYKQALQKYQLLMSRNFEIPGTLTHITRIHLVCGQKRKACRAIRKAWQWREPNTPGYVMARIIWFKILISFLRNENKNARYWTGCMKNLIYSSRYEDMEWHITKTLSVYEKELSLDVFRLLSELVIVLSQRHYKFIKLEKLDFWKSCAPVKYSPSGRPLLKILFASIWKGSFFKT